MSADPIRIEILAESELGAIRPLLAELILQEQRHYDHPQLTPEVIAQDVRRPVRPHFTGETIIFGARDAKDRVVGLCWCVLFDPGTGLEAEVAEVFVERSHRNQGLAGAMLRRAVQLFRDRGVTFACVWTRETNPQAIRLYEQAGFSRTAQLVLTWLPLPDR
jgi:GNAT superfamily N-acetyltransferase